MSCHLSKKKKELLDYLKKKKIEEENLEKITNLNFNF